STSFDLGTSGGNTQASGIFLPMMNPVASSATLSLQNTSDTMNIAFSGSSGTTTLTYPLAILQYQSQNNYWIQQTYYYEDGGVFLTQTNGSVCRVAPPISFANANSTYIVAITPITLIGAGSMGGNGPVRVDSRLKTLQAPTQGTEYWVNTSVTV